MKKAKRVCFVAAFCALSLVVTVGLSTKTNRLSETAFSEATISYVSEEEGIADSYIIGSPFKIPSATLNIDGREYPAENVVFYTPDGKAYTADSYTLNSLGRYKVVYSAIVDGKAVIAEKTFTVNGASCKVSSDSSSVTYAEKLVLSENNVSGLQISLADGDEFIFNEPVDLSKNGDDFISFFTYSCNDKIENMDWKSEVGKLTVTLTDCYAPDNYVVFEINYIESIPGKTVPYYRTGANGRETGGWVLDSTNEANGRTTKEVFLNGERYRVNFRYGVAASEGTYSKNAYENREWKNWNGNYKLSYDVETNCIYVKDGAGLVFGKDGTVGSVTGARIPRMIGEVDNVDLYGKNTFKGFTTGEVYVSVKGTTYSAETMRIEIDGFAGKTSEELKPVEQADVKPPVVEILSDRETAYVAVGETFNLYRATAADVNLIGEIKTAVYYRYGKPEQVQVSVTDGAFTPAKTGEYTVVYSARDAYGNVGKKTTTVYAVPTESGRTVDFSTDRAETVRAGVETVLPAYSADGLNGDVTVDIYAVRRADGYRTDIDSVSRIFLPVYAGEYEIVFEYGDGVKNYSYSYTAVCTPSETVRFFGKPTLPLYFMKGAGYSLDVFYAYVFTEGTPAKAMPELYASEDGGEYRSASFDEFVVSGTDSVRFKYVYGDLNYVSDEIPVVDVGFGTLPNHAAYFIGNVTGTAKENEILVKSRNVTGDTAFDFINPVSFKNLQIKFKIPEEYAEFERIEIEIIDYYNRENSVSATYRKQAGFTALLFNGAGETWKQTVPFAGQTHAVSYKPNLQTMSLDGTSFYCAGGFTSDKVLLRFTLYGIEGEGGVEIQQIDNQTFSVYGNDYVNPMVETRESCGVRALNEIVTVYAASATDVSTPVLKKHIRVWAEDPSGNFVRDETGVLLDGTTLADKDYKIKLTSYGMYRVGYIVTDQNGNEYSYAYPVTAADREPPALTLSDGYDESTVVPAKLGDRIAVATAIATDSVTPADKLGISVTAFAPDGYAVAVTDGTFTANKKGLWRIVYLCFDETGNLTTRYYNVRVQ